MKIIISIIIGFVVIIVGSLMVNKNLEDSSNEINKSIESIEEYVNSADWDNASKKLTEMNSEWSKTRITWAMLIDHEEIDYIDEAVHKVGKYIELRDNSAEFFAEISVLKLYIKHIPQKEAFLLRNIL